MRAPKRRVEATHPSVDDHPADLAAVRGCCGFPQQSVVQAKPPDESTIAGTLLRDRNCQCDYQPGDPVLVLLRAIYKDGPVICADCCCEVIIPPEASS